MDFEGTDYHFFLYVLAKLELLDHTDYIEGNMHHPDVLAVVTEQCFGDT